MNRNTSRKTKKFLTIILLAYLMELIKMLNKFSSGYAYIFINVTFAWLCSHTEEKRNIYIYPKFWRLCFILEKKEEICVAVIVVFYSLYFFVVVVLFLYNYRSFQFPICRREYFFYACFTHSVYCIMKL